MGRLICQVVIDGGKTIDEVANRVLDEFSYHGKTIREWADSISNPKTIGDWLRTLSDEELAQWIIAHGDCPVGYVQIKSCFEKSCKDCWSEWLKSPAEEGAG